MRVPIRHVTHHKPAPSGGNRPVSLSKWGNTPSRTCTELQAPSVQADTLRHMQSPIAVGRGSTRHQQTAVTMLARCRCRESRTCSSIDRQPSQPGAASPATPSGRAFGCVRLVVQANQATLEPATDCIQPHVHVSTCCGNSSAAAAALSRVSTSCNRRTYINAGCTTACTHH